MKRRNVKAAAEDGAVVAKAGAAKKLKVRPCVQRVGGDALTMECSNRAHQVRRQMPRPLLLPPLWLLMHLVSLSQSRPSTSNCSAISWATRVPCRR